MPAGRKAVVCTLLSSGLLLVPVLRSIMRSHNSFPDSPFCMAIAKISSFFSSYDESDISWSLVLLFIWNASEINSIIVAACVPTLPPLYRALRGRESRRHRYTYPFRDMVQLATMSDPSDDCHNSSHKDRSRITNSGLTMNGVMGEGHAKADEGRIRRVGATVTGSGREREIKEAIIVYGAAN